MSSPPSSPIPPPVYRSLTNPPATAAEVEEAGDSARMALPPAPMENTPSSGGASGKEKEMDHELELHRLHSLLAALREIPPDPVPVVRRVSPKANYPFKASCIDKVRSRMWFLQKQLKTGEFEFLRKAVLEPAGKGPWETVYRRAWIDITEEVCKMLDARKKNPATAKAVNQALNLPMGGV